MNSVQLHLALTHVPIILSLIGFVMLVIALLLQNQTVIKTSYFIIIAAGIFAIPVFFTGEGTEEAIENLPGVSEAIIERHEDVAKLAMISISLAGLMALAAIFTMRWKVAAGIYKIVVLILVIASGILMGQTAHLGGQIRHTEIRNGIAIQNEQGEMNGEGKTNVQEEDDD